MTTPLISDGVLIKRYIDGNNAAFETLLKRHRSRILSSIYLLVGDRYVAEDIFQETFIKVIHSIQKGKYNHEDKFLPWVLRIARNMSIDTIRARKRMPVVVDTEGRDLRLAFETPSDKDSWKKALEAHVSYSSKK